MEPTIFNKMKAKPGQSACVFYPPESYPLEESQLCFNNTSEQVEFVHLFVSSREQNSEGF